MKKLEGNKRIKVFLNDTKKKNSLKIIKEVLFLMVKKREIPYYYFKYLYRNSINNYLDYLSTGEINLIGSSKKLHRPEYRQILESKLFFSFLMEKAKIRTPKLKSYNLGANFFVDGKIKKIADTEAASCFFEEIFANSSVAELFFRPLSDYGGKGCFKLTKEHLGNDIEKAYKLLIEGNFVHTEVIRQHPKVDEIHKYSVSTLRILSLITSSNKIEIISCFMRFGVGTSVVDNISSGGFFVGVNMEDGTLQKTGHYLPEYGGGEIENHPDSNFSFAGFKVPYLKEAFALVKEASDIILNKFIGWDVAIAQDGPTIVEANGAPHIPSIDIAYGGLLRNGHIRQLVGELKEVG